VFVFLCAELCRSAFIGIVTRGKHYRPDFTELVLQSSLTLIHRKKIHFCSRWQWYWQWHRWCSSRKLHNGLTNANSRPTVPVVTGLQASEWVTTDRATPLSVLTVRQGRPSPSTNQLKRFDTSQKRHWLMQCKQSRYRVFCQKQTITKF